ncbi:MAG TPA: 3'-5' exonuclease [Bacteroidia bacterium]|nr:3'-5' exonuclease [Bacteroidia bacterium]
MLENISIENILFLDIETVPQYPSFDDVPENEKEHWIRKAEQLKKGDADTAAALYPRAGIYAEFGKIICISTGYFTKNSGARQFRIKSFCGDDEKILLNDFSKLLYEHFNRSQHLLCGHNGKEFDFPYLSRRLLINGIKIPPLLDTAGRKPWEVQHLDTMELWKFGDYKSFTPLNLLANVFGITSPKDDIDGSMVWFVYWKEKNLNRIVTYCQKDVVTVAQILLRMKGEPLIPGQQINIV